MPQPEYNAEKNNLVNDAVNHPKHYTSHPSGIECIEIVKHHDCCISNVIKYCWRAGLKNNGNDAKEKEIQDLEKAMFYLKCKIEMLKKN